MGLRLMQEEVSDLFDETSVGTQQTVRDGSPRWREARTVSDTIDTTESFIKGTNKAKAAAELAELNQQLIAGANAAVDVLDGLVSFEWNICHITSMLLSKPSRTYTPP
jgi:uncharacterized protein YhaN